MGLESETEPSTRHLPDHYEKASMALALQAPITGHQLLDTATDTDKAQYWSGDARVGVDGALHVHSKRTERLRKKQQKRQKKPLIEARGILDLPYELILDVFALLRPSDLFRLSRVNRSLHDFIFKQEATLASNIVKWRYPCLEQCLRLPVPLTEVDVLMCGILQLDQRQEIMTIHKKPYQHIQSPDPAFICTCLTCLLRWNSLCLAVDFAHWQGNLDKGEPIPIIPRGRSPAWNQRLVAAHANVVIKALSSPLMHATILEAHLKSTTNSIRRHRENKGNKRRRFRMTQEDLVSGTDAFLQRSGPPTTDFPFHRDNYYMLEAYLPNRGWNGEEGRWAYMPADQHQTDLGYVMRWAAWKFGENIPLLEDINIGVQKVHM